MSIDVEVVPGKTEFYEVVCGCVAIIPRTRIVVNLAFLAIHGVMVKTPLEVKAFALSLTWTTNWLPSPKWV